MRRITFEGILPNLFSMKRFYAVIGMFVFAVAAAVAQPISGSSYEMMLSTAEACLAKKDYYNALEWYEKAYDENKDGELRPMIAELHLLLRDYVRAERTYAAVLRRDRTNAYMHLRFNYGKVLKMNEKYPEAIAELQLFLEESDNDSLKVLARAELTGAELAMELPDLSNGVAVTNLGKNVNTSFSEYAPALGKGGQELFFAGFDTKEVIIVDENNQNYHARVFVSSRAGESWSKPSPLGSTINRPGVHTSHVSVSPDGRTLFLTRSVLEGNVVSDSRIYYAMGGEGEWGAANEVEGVNGDYLAKHAVAGELFGREVLFFVSNMPGGQGGFDLYYANRLSDGKYSTPVNLGADINTSGDEETPFYRDGTLYFSSNGHPTIGGFDIFYAAWDGQNWGSPQNMGKGYNTSVDDKYFSIDAEGYNGFLVSNRDAEGARSTHSSTCCDDMYAFEVDPLYTNLVAGVFDEGRQALTGATVQLTEVLPNRTTMVGNQTNDSGNRFDFELEFDRQYYIVASKEGFYPDTLTFSTLDLETSKTFEERFFLKAKPVPPAEPEYDTIAMEEVFVLENILYDFDDDRIKPEAETDLEVVWELMNQYPDMKIELGSHTDNRGDATYNRTLSQRRAESARRWLMRKGVPRERINAVGYGEEVPKTVTDKVSQTYNYLPAGAVLTGDFINALTEEEQQEVAHAINRRTEFKIIEGPTSITIKRTRLRSNQEDAAKNRKALPRATTSPQTTNPEIHPFSSLYGKKNLKGVPIMVFKEREVDFGKVPKGEQRYHTYTFTNKGDVPLKISTVVACECTIADFSYREVPPGGTAELDVTFDSTEKDGEETISLDIILDNLEPGSGNPIIEKIKYHFVVVKG